MDNSYNYGKGLNIKPGKLAQVPVPLKHLHHSHGSEAWQQKPLQILPRGYRFPRNKYTPG